MSYNGDSIKILITGSKEYPVGTNKGEDPYPSGGIEVYIEKLTEKFFGNRNFDFIIITRKFKGTPNYEKRGNIEIYRVPWIKGFYFRNISFNIAAFIKALTLNFDLIFSQGLFATLFGILLSRLKRKPIVGVAHGTAASQPQYNKFLRFMLKNLETFTFSKLNYLISLSPEETRKFGKIVRNIKVIPIGIEIQEYYTLNKSEAKKKIEIDDKVVITFVGRLLKVKGTEYLIEALSGIDRDFVCLIVGSGPDEDFLRKLAKKRGLEDKVKFLGFRRDIPEILKATDIFVLPSLSEGLCLSLLEAKAAGCACIVFDIGLPVKDGVDAIVVKTGNIKELRDAIEKLITDKKLRKELGKGAYEDVIKNYSWNFIIKEYERFFESIARNSVETKIK